MARWTRRQCEAIELPAFAAGLVAAEAEHILALCSTRQTAAWMLIEEAARQQLLLIDTWRQRELATYPFRRR
jgi:hypothetical protein